MLLQRSNAEMDNVNEVPNVCWNMRSIHFRIRKGTYSIGSGGKQSFLNADKLQKWPMALESGKKTENLMR